MNKLNENASNTTAATDTTTGDVVKSTTTKAEDITVNTQTNDSGKSKDDLIRHWQGVATDAQYKLKAFDGVNLDKVKADAEDYQNLLKEKAGLDDEAHATLSSEIEGRFRGALDSANESNQNLTKQVQQLTIQNEAKSKIVSQFNEDVHGDVERAVLDATTVIDGKVVIRGDDGKPQYSTKNPGELMSLTEWIDDYAAARPSMVRSTQSTGGRTSGSTSSANGQSGNADYESYKTMDNTQRAANFTTKQRMEFSGRLSEEKNRFRAN